MRDFLLLWLGQLVSLTGSGLTGFALGLWVYQRTGSVTDFALISMFTLLPQIVLSPLAGALIDRWDRRRVMMLSDLVAGIVTLTMSLLLMRQQLMVWQIYLGMALISTCNAFQLPAYFAATSLLLPPEQRGRGSGMVQLGQAVGQIAAPVLAGVFVLTIGINGVLVIDFATYVFAVGTLALVHIPRAEATPDQTGKGSLGREIAYGWSYLTSRPGLLGLMLFITAANFMLGIISVLVTPLVLAIASPAVLGSVMSTGGIGMLVGSVVMSAWGGPKRRVSGVLGFMLLGGLCILVGGLRPSTLLIAFAAFGFFFCLPIINGCNMAILQSKVAPDVLGRVFALSNMLVAAAMPLSFVLAGPLADRVFERLLVDGGPLAGSIGAWIGVGPGRGIGLLFIVLGILIELIVAAAYAYPRIRLVEDELPDVGSTSEAAMDTNEPAPGHARIEAPLESLAGAGDV